MPLKFRVQKIDPESIGLHSYLTSDDACYYLGEYTSRQGYGYSEINQLILNLKKSPSRRLSKPNEYQYKLSAIQTVAHAFRQAITAHGLSQHITLMPAPPSKTQHHDEYDDRMLQVCLQATADLDNSDVAELVQTVRDMEATHTEARKPSPDELIENYRIVCPKGYSPRQVILVVDDVLTTGSHFKACKRLLIDEFPNSRVAGLFVARRVFPPRPTNSDEF
jgi:predicted amidophosphoribosyltransferase